MWYLRGLRGEGLWTRTESPLMRWVIYVHVMPTERYENVLQDKIEETLQGMKIITK